MCNSRYSLNLIGWIAIFVSINLVDLYVTEVQAESMEFENPGSADHNEHIESVALVPAAAGSHGVTELMMAVSNEDLARVRLLANLGADVDAADVYERSVLSWAVGTGNFHVTQTLLEAGAEPNRTANDGWSPLSSAVQDGSEEISLLLLQYGADPDTYYSSSFFQPPSRESVLEIAARKGRVAIVDALIDAGVDLESTGWAALDSAAGRGSTQIVVALMLAGVDATASDGRNGGAPLLSAAAGGHGDIVKLLLTAGSDPNHATEDGRTPLLFAAAGGHADVVKSLLTAGSDPNRETNDGRTSLFVAVQKNHPQTVALLLANGAEATARQIIHAIYNESDEVIRSLLVRIDIDDMLEIDKIELLRLAEATNRQELIAGFLAIDKAKPDSQHAANFLFALDIESDSTCDVMIWDPRLNTQMKVFSLDKPCWGRFSVAEDDEKLFVLDNNEIRVVSTEDGAEVETVALPVELMAETDRLLAERFRDHFGEGYDRYAHTGPNVAGYLSSGELAFMASAGGPADGTYSYLYAREGEEWRLIDEQICGRFESHCGFGRIESRRVMDWPQERAASHPYIRKNSFFLAKSSTAIEDPNYEVSRFRIDFDFGSQGSTLTYDIVEGDYCDGDCIFTRKIGVEGSMGTKILSEAYLSNNSVVGRFVLMQRSEGKAELFDMTTGESVFGQLLLGTWIE